MTPNISHQTTSYTDGGWREEDMYRFKDQNFKGQGHTEIFCPYSFVAQILKDS